MTDSTPSPKKPIRWWLGIRLLLLGGAAIVWTRLQNDWAFQKRNLITYEIIIVVLMVVPIFIMGVYSFYTFQTAGVETSDLTLANWHEFFTDSFYHGFLWKTVRVSIITALLCAVMGYPPAYFIAMTEFKHKWLLLLLLIVPFWISFTIRTFSWIHILGEKGAINASLMGLGIISEPLPLLYNEGSVIMGLIHFLLPYMILNVYVTLEGIDRNLISAARSLGCTEWQAFREVTLPLLAPAILASLLLVFTISFDNISASMFWRPAGVETMPTQILSMLKVSITPEVNALGTLMILITVGLPLLGGLLARAMMRQAT